MRKSRLLFQRLLELVVEVVEGAVEQCHDAVDEGLTTLTDDFRIVASKELKRKTEPFVIEVLLPLDGRVIEPPERFAPPPK